MKYLNYKDNNRRKNYLNTELEYLKLKAFTHNRTLPKSIQFYYFMQFNRFTKNNLKIRIKNRCVITNKAQSVYKDFHLNRVALKEYVSSDTLVGVRKTSW